MPCDESLECLLQPGLVELLLSSPISACVTELGRDEASNRCCWGASLKLEISFVGVPIDSRHRPRRVQRSSIECNSVLPVR